MLVHLRTVPVAHRRKIPVRSCGHGGDTPLHCIGETVRGKRGQHPVTNHGKRRPLLDEGHVRSIGGQTGLLVVDDLVAKSIRYSLRMSDPVGYGKGYR